MVILDLDSNDELDITSVEALAKLAASLDRRGIALALAHLHGPAEEIARADGLLDALGPGRVFPNLPLALAWATAPR